MHVQTKQHFPPEPSNWTPQIYTILQQVQMYLETDEKILEETESDLNHRTKEFSVLECILAYKQFDLITTGHMAHISGVTGPQALIPPS